MGDSTDEFLILDRADLPEDSQPEESVEQVQEWSEKSDWSEEFDVGSDPESKSSRESLFSGTGAFFKRLFGHSSQDDSDHFTIVSEEIDLDSETESVSAPPSGAASRQAEPPRIIDVQAIDLRKAPPGVPVVRPIPDSPSSIDSDPLDPLPEADFFPERDELQIAHSIEGSRRIGWLDILSFPLTVPKRLSSKFRRSHESDEEADEFKVARGRALKKGGSSTSAYNPPGEAAPDPLSSLTTDRIPIESDGLPLGDSADELEIGSRATARTASVRDNGDRNAIAPENAEHDDDYSVIESSRRGKSLFRPNALAESASTSAQDGSDPGADPESNSDDHAPMATSFSGRMQDLLEYSNQSTTGSHEMETIAVGVPLESDTVRPDLRARSRGSLVFRFLGWLISIPKRCLTSEGDLFEQRRLKLEPILASLPAIGLALSFVVLIVRVSGVDKIESSRRFLNHSIAQTKAGDRNAAMIAAMRACEENSTPRKLYNYASIFAVSENRETAIHGLRLLRFLASPAGGNQADAHLFIADSIFSRLGNDPANLNSNFQYYLSELRAGFEAEPSRYDILERLAEGLLKVGDFSALTGILTPNLEFWPFGHYFLAQSAFARGDDILQKSHALAMVRFLRGSPAELELERKNRIRFVVSLALAGEFGEAESYLSKMAESPNSDPDVNSLGEQVRLIRTIARINEFPSGSDQDIEVLGAQLMLEDLSPGYVTAIQRQLIRKGPLRPALLLLCDRLHDARKAKFNAEDYVFWASILRQNQKNDQAREFLENAVRISPNHDVAANNLANLLYKLKPYDLERALTLVDGVVQRNPKSITFVETRGQILARLGRNEEAIAELTRCLESFPNVPEIHETLAKCHKLVGNTALADAHMARFETLTAKPAPGTNSGSDAAKP
jgi:tetratricopeptide (TPR) repeat protein